MIIVSGGGSATSTAQFVNDYLTGLTLSTAGSSATFTVADGLAADSTNAEYISLSSSLSKTTSAWSAGAAGGALDTGSIAASTWYYAYVILKNDTITSDVLVSLSATSPTMPSGWTWYRRIGAMQTDVSSHWYSFTQTGDDFARTTGVIDVNATVTTSRSSLTLSSAPPNMPARIRAYAFHGTTQAGVVIQPTSETDGTPTGSAAPLYSLYAETANAGAAGEFEVMTDSSGQIAVRASQTNTTVRILTRAWRDTRGKG